jgi:hypothetical protein
MGRQRRGAFRAVDRLAVLDELIELHDLRSQVEIDRELARPVPRGFRDFGGGIFRRLRPRFEDQSVELVVELDRRRSGRLTLGVIHEPGSEEERRTECGEAQQSSNPGIFHQAAKLADPRTRGKTFAIP